MKDKILYLIAEKTNLSSVSSKEAIAGIYNNYNVAITTANYVYYLDFPLKLTSDYPIERLNNFLVNLRDNNKRITKCFYKDASVVIAYSSKGNREKSASTIITILDAIVQEATLNNLVTCCGICGEERDVTPFVLNGRVFTCCKSCQYEIKDSINTQQEEFKSSNNNIVGGIVGAFLGSLIGVAVWLVISHLGYIASIAGLAIAVCCIKGFKMFGGKLNVSGMVITSIITIIMVYVSNHLALGLAIYTEYKSLYNISFFDSLKAVPEFLTETTIKMTFIKDLVIGYILTLAGSASYFKNAYREANYKIEAEELDF